MYTHLLAPGRIGTLELRNRIIMAPMGDRLANADGTISDNQAAYFEARARGGAGMLLVGSVSVSYPYGAFDDQQTAASDDSFLPGLIDLTTRVHRHGARIAAQLTHNGSFSLYDTAMGRPVLVPAVPKAANPDHILTMVTEGEVGAMSWAYVQPTSRLVHQVATEHDLAWVVERFVDSVERCQRAGFDGVELHAGHGYLIDEFLTPSMNTRTDGWGGTVENRARLLCDIIRSVRARVGPEYPLWMRINAVEHHKTVGETFADQQRVIELAVAAGLDAVHVTAYASTDVATGPTDSYAPHTYTKGAAGSLTEYARAVRGMVDVPVITFGRMEPDEAEQVLADGVADFVVMGRKLLADPDLPNKLAEGRSDDVRPCIYQYRCIGNIFVRDTVHCVSNAQTGREHDLAVGRAARPRRVLVVGGGAAGLETARVLAGSGHQVTIWDAAERLGGMLVHAGAADTLLERYLGWLLRQVEQLGVEIQLGQRATAEAVLGARVDDVVIATGARWGRPDVPGAELAHVHTVPELGAWLHDDGPAIGDEVVVLGGGKPGLSIAALCRRRGRSVTVVEPTHVFCVELGLPGRFRLVADAERDGVVLLGRAELQRIERDAVVVSIDGVETRLPASSVIVASGATPEPRLADELRSAGLHPHVAGDCHAVARIEGANLDAAAIALSLSVA
jgi:2,4-dienoyl-CoA reductase-like NADH-dependent reductase (Old Yellow Enzyme family)/thioredoxin reductase